MFEISHGNESGGDKNQQLHKARFNDECLYSGNRDILSRLDFSLRITFSAKREKGMHY